MAWTNYEGGVGGAAAHGDGGVAVFGVGKMVVDWCDVLGEMMLCRIISMVWCRIISHEEG